jgi:hypothetical protein
MGSGVIVAQAQAASSTPKAQTIGDFFTCADTGDRALRLAWSWTTCPSGTARGPEATELLCPASPLSSTGEGLAPAGRALAGGTSER